MAIERPDDLTDIADLGLTLSETKRLLATLQQEIVAAQMRDHAVRRPNCSRCGGGCRVKDHQDRVVATLFGQVTVLLPRFRCAACCGSEPGIERPSHHRSTPELDRLQAVIVGSLEDDKAENIITMDLAGKAMFCDRMVIASGLADRQISAMATHLTEKLHEAGQKRVDAGQRRQIAIAASAIAHIA